MLHLAQAASTAASAGIDKNTLPFSQPTVDLAAIRRRNALDAVYATLERMAGMDSSKDGDDQAGYRQFGMNFILGAG